MKIPATPSTTRARWRGEDVELRIPTTRDRRFINQAFEPPVAPLAPNPMKGSLAPWEPNEGDPAYVRAREAHARQAAVAELAIALDVEVDATANQPPRWADCTTPEARKAWLESAVDFVESEIAPAELAHLRDSISLAILNRLPREALGN